MYRFCFELKKKTCEKHLLLRSDGSRNILSRIKTLSESLGSKLSFDRKWLSITEISSRGSCTVLLDLSAQISSANFHEIINTPIACHSLRRLKLLSLSHIHIVLQTLIRIWAALKVKLHYFYELTF